MIKPVSTKLTGTAVPGPETGRDLNKFKTSRFEEVRAKLRTDSAVELPPEITQVPKPERQRIERDLRVELERTATKGPGESIKAQMKSTESKVDALRKQVDVLPPEPVFEPLRARLNNIERKYSQSAEYVNGLRANTTPADFLRIQLEMYQLTQNIELVSKVVDQVNGGVKSILQTQV